MAKLSAGLVCTGSLGRSSILCATFVTLLMLLAVSAMATVATDAALAVKTAMRALRCALRAAAYDRVVMCVTLALIISGLLCHLSFRRGLESLVVFRIKASAVSTSTTALRQASKVRYVVPLCTAARAS